MDFRTRILIVENSNPLRFQELPDDIVDIQGKLVPGQDENGAPITVWDGDTLAFAPFPTFDWRWEINFPNGSPFQQTRLDSALAPGETIPPDLPPDPAENPGITPEIEVAKIVFDGNGEQIFDFEIKAVAGSLESAVAIRRMRIRRRLG